MKQSVKRNFALRSPGNLFHSLTIDVENRSGQVSLFTPSVTGVLYFWTDAHCVI